MTILEMQDKRAGLISQARVVNEKALAEQRALSDSERSQFDGLMAEADGLGAVINDSRKLEAVDVELRKIEKPVVGMQSADGEKFDTRAYARALSHALQGDATELRAMGVFTDSTGGYLLPMQLAAPMQVLMDMENPIRQYATIFDVTGNVAVPYDNDSGAAAQRAEGAAITGADASIGEITMNPRTIITAMPFSIEMLERIDVNQLFGIWGAQRIAAKERNLMITGDGSAKITGLLAASGGAAAAQTTATSATLTSDEVIAAYYAVSPIYRRSGKCAWIMDTTTLLKIRTMKDSVNGGYIWAPGFGASPDTILGKPVIEMTDMPDFAAGAKAMLFGDLSQYYIAQLPGISIFMDQVINATDGSRNINMWRSVDAKLLRTSGVKLTTIKS